MAGGSWQDRPPEGSIAESLLMAATSAEAVSAASIGEGADVTPTAESLEAIEGITVERCAYVEAALSLAGIPPAEYDGYASENLGVPAGRWARSGPSGRPANGPTGESGPRTARPTRRLARSSGRGASRG